MGDADVREAGCSTVFPDFTLEVFEDRHHFDPPLRVEPERLARSLEALWSRARGAGSAVTPRAGRRERDFRSTGPSDREPAEHGRISHRPIFVTRRLVL